MVTFISYKEFKKTTTATAMGTMARRLFQNYFLLAIVIRVKSLRRALRKSPPGRALIPSIIVLFINFSIFIFDFLLVYFIFNQLYA